MILARIANFDKATHRFFSRLCDFVFFAMSHTPLCTPPSQYLRRQSNQKLQEQKDAFKRNQSKLNTLTVRAHEPDQVLHTPVSNAHTTLLTPFNSPSRRTVA
jgi:hypothetical protein